MFCRVMVCDPEHRDIRLYVLPYRRMILVNLSAHADAQIVQLVFDPAFMPRILLS